MDLKRVTNAKIYHKGVDSDHRGVQMSMRIARNLKVRSPNTDLVSSEFTDYSKLKSPSTRTKYCEVVKNSIDHTEQNKYAALQGAIKKAEAVCCKSKRKRQPGWFEASSEVLEPLIDARNTASTWYKTASQAQLTAAKVKFTLAQAAV